MGKGILSAVAKVFPKVPDFICHFHFLRDIDKDFLGSEYDIIRKRLRHHGISAKLHDRAKQLKVDIDDHPNVIEALQEDIENAELPPESFAFAPLVNAYSLNQWALQGKSEGLGYGFPFDRPHLAFANRLKRLNTDIERIQHLHLRSRWQDNRPYFKIHIALKPIMKDQALWKAVEAIEKKTLVFEKLREAMRIAPKSACDGLNDEGRKGNIRTIEARVKNSGPGWSVARTTHKISLP